MGNRIVGHCACCSEFVWDAGSDPAQWPGSRCTMLLADGSQMDVTLCPKCLRDPDFDLIWKNVVAGWAAEKAEDYAAKQATKNMILSLLYNTPWNVVDLSQFRVLARK